MKHREQEFLRLMKDADRRFYAEIAGRRADPDAFAASRKGKASKVGKHLGKIGKIAVGAVLTAAVLGAGGMAAIVAMRGTQGGNNQSDGSSRAAEVTSSQTDGTAALHLNLTDGGEWCEINTGDSYIADQMWFTASDTGWYHEINFELIDDLRGGGENSFTDAENERMDAAESAYNTSKPRNDIIWYYDSETGEDVPLCAHPNCLHDGNEYCEATTAKYYRGKPLYYDGVLYCAARSTDEDDPENYRRCLLSYALDGTGITELAVFSKGEADPLDMIIHRGYVFCLYRVRNGALPSESEFDFNNPYKGTGYAIYAYEIATGKTTEVLSVMPKENNSNDCEEPPRFLSAGGDMLYFSSESAWPATYTVGLYGLNLRSGEVKALLSGTESSTRECTAGKYILYRKQVKVNQYQFCILDTETGESKTYSDIPSGITVSDGKHVAICKQAGTADDHCTVYLYDMQMQLQGTLAGPAGRDFLTLRLIGGDICALMGASYRSGGIISADDPDTCLVRCKTADLKAGSADWETLCTIEKIQRLSALLN